MEWSFSIGGRAAGRCARIWGNCPPLFRTAPYSIHQNFLDKNFSFPMDLPVMTLLFVFSPSIFAYPQFGPQFGYSPSEHQPMSMTPPGMEPIMPINYMTGGFGPMRHSSPSQFGPFGASPDQIMMAAQQNPHSPISSLLIRNSPYQSPPLRTPFVMNHFYGADGGTGDSLAMQPLFPQGMAVGKNGYGLTPSSAVLPSDIPMDVLVGKQIVQNGLDEQSQSMSSKRAQLHPFPLNPFLGSDGGGGSSSFGGAFGTDSPQKMGAGEQQELQQLPPTAEPSQPTMPTPEGTTPATGPTSGPFVPRPVISAETQSSPTTDPNSAALPVFLRGATQEQIEEFKRIIRQPNGTYAEQVRQIDALVQRMEPNRQMMYRDFMRENDERERLHRDKVHKTVAEMSGAAQEQFAKISATLRNPNVPDQDRWERVLQLYSKMEPELRNEFEQKFKGFPPFSPALL